jgi:hypothetical protein
MCPSGFEQIVAAALAGPATGIQRVLVQRFLMAAASSVAEAKRCCD